MITRRVKLEIVSALVLGRICVDDGEQLLSYRLRQFQNYKSRSGVKVVFAGIVDDSKAAKLRSFGVCQGAINLAELKVFVTGTIDTDCNADFVFFLVHSFQSKAYLTFILRRPTPCASYQ